MRNERSQLTSLIENLTLRRIEKGTSIDDLALKIGYTRWTLMKWENFQRTPRLDRFIDWVESLGGRIKVEWDNGQQERK